MPDLDMKPGQLQGALIMAGGKGKRFGDPFKFLRSVEGISIIDRLIAFIRALTDQIYICTGKDEFGQISEICRRHRLRAILTDGSGYAPDLMYSLSSIDSFPVLVSGADVCIIDPQKVRIGITEALRWGHESVSIFCGNEATGISVILRKPRHHDPLSYVNMEIDDGSVVNVNRIEDLERAEHLIRIYEKDHPGIIS